MKATDNAGYALFAPAIPGNRSVVSEVWLAYNINIHFQHLGPAHE
jgi:hypothetical protein